MYRVLIIDDEVWTIKGIKASCNWSQLDCKVVFDTTSPTEALDYLAHNKVDIVMVDIHMDEMNGLDLIKEARLKGATCEFIIISGHSEFDYARSALQYGVFDYILKPIDRQKLHDTLHNLIQYMHLNKDKITSASYVESILNHQLEDIEMAFIEQGQHINYQGFQGLILQDPQVTEYIKESIIYHDKPFISYEIGKHKFFLVINTDEDIAPLINQAPIKGGMSTFTTTPLEWSKLYYEADLAFANNFIYSPKIYPYERTLGKGELIIQTLIANKGHGYNDYVDKIIENARDYKIEEYVLLYNATVTWCNYYYGGAQHYHLIAYDEVNESFKDLKEFIQYLKDMVVHAIEKWPVYSGDDQANMTLILDYIHDNYQSDLYLSDLAGAFFYNPSYISSLFKKHIGKTFSSYLKEIRLKEASRLLTETNDTVTEISQNIGYKDYCYFSKLFKGSYGVTPLQYRKNLHREDHHGAS